MSDSSMADLVSSLVFVMYTNATPSTAQKRAIKALIAAAEAEIAEIDQDVAHALEKRKSRASQVLVYRAALSPCRRLPPELISEIFLHVVDGQVPECDRSFVGFDIRTPIRLAQICCSWREIAIATPKLWARIGLDFTQKSSLTSYSHSREESLLKTFAERASRNPLLIHLTWDDETKDSQTPIQILTPYLSRTTYLSLEIPHCYFEGLQHVPQNSFPLLERFRIDVNRTDEDIDTTYSVMEEPFRSAQNLKEFYYSGQFSDRAIRLPQRLTRLELSGMTAAQCVSTLAHCPNIEEFACLICEPGLLFPDQPTILPWLRVLNIKIDPDPQDNTAFACIVNYITTPALDKLSLTCSAERKVTWCSYSFMQFFLRSSCAPKQLDMSLFIEMEDLDIVEILQLLPSLVHIRVASILVTDRVLRLLVYGGLGRILPKLETIELQAWYSFTHELVLQVVNSRWWPDDDNLPTTNRPCRLTKFHMGYMHPRTSNDRVTKDTTLELERLRSQGLDVRIA